MAAWCFVCDVPVAGDSCSGCGRSPVMVEDAPRDVSGATRRLGDRLREVPGWLWPLMAIALAAALFPLFQAAFFLE